METKKTPTNVIRRDIIKAEQGGWIVVTITTNNSPNHWSAPFRTKSEAKNWVKHS